MLVSHSELMEVLILVNVHAKKDFMMTVLRFVNVINNIIKNAIIIVLIVHKVQLIVRFVIIIQNFPELTKFLPVPVKMAILMIVYNQFVKVIIIIK